jgi:hypothetical protein
MKLPPHLAVLLPVLKSAFPDGVSELTRVALLAVLWNELSEENFGILLAEFLDDEAVVVVRDAILALDDPSAATAMGDVEQRLRESGWRFEQN